MILVTGATGLIGSNLYKTLDKRLFDVRGISTKDGDLTDEKLASERAQLAGTGT